MEGNEAGKRKVQIISQAYYSRKEVQEEIYKFCKKRETVPRYLEGFGKRPDVLDYPSDVLSLVKKGATSFHCSEEIWSDPLKIVTDMSPEQYNEIRDGWDFLIDIDSKYLDYSKIAAKVLIEALETHGIKSIGIKYSGSKGFHIIVPFAAFPEEMFGQKTKDMFPEWPRAIAGYLKEITKNKVNEEIIRLSGKEKLKKEGELIEKIYCSDCSNIISERKEDLFECTNLKCKYKLYFKQSRRKEPRCPNCNFDMRFIHTQVRYFCEECKKYKPKPAAQLKSEQTTKSQENSVDIVLVAPRHLFRAPYSLHEKTSLASVVLSKEEFEKFDISMADPLKINFRDYQPKPKEDEGRNLLLHAIEWAKKTEPEKKKFEGKAIDLKGLKISEAVFPDVILKILEGIKSDGRKRALSILIAFFTSLDLPREYIEEKVEKWNKKNVKPLKEGYIRAQIDWGMKHKRLPPNYDKSLYKEVVPQGFSSDGLKNPINYTIREALRNKGREERKKDKKD